MQKIFKYNIAIARCGEPQRVLVPAGSLFLKDAVPDAYQDSLIALYFLVETDRENLDVETFFVFGTGHMIPKQVTDTCEYVRAVSITTAGLPFVWHIWRQVIQ